MSEIKITDLSFAYKDQPNRLILKDINIEVEHGEFVCLLGPSGCGKSTFLRLLAGLEDPTGGTLEMNGKPLKGSSLDRSVVFQDYGLFPWMTAGENIMLALQQKYPKKPKKELKEVALNMMKEVGLDKSVFKKLPKALSGGMKQRCAIARSLSIDPPILLMDALMDVDDEVMVMRPYYPGYTSFILNWQGKKVEVDPDPQTFQPDFEDFESKITERTKLVIVNSPNNPTGAIYTEDTIQRLAQILEKKEQAYGHEIYLLSDEPYRELVYTGETLPYLTKYYNNTLVAYSFSKSLSVPGERIGYLVIPDEASESQMLIKAVKMTTGMIGYVNAPSLFQKVVAECLDEKANLEFYQKNRDILYKKLCDLGFEVVPPSGAFYIFIKAPGGDEKRFLEKAHECNILLVGGSFFGYVGYARISFCVSHEKILRSLTAFEKLAELMRE